MISYVKAFLERANFLVSVPKCVSCGEPLDFEDKALCKKCELVFQEQKLRGCSSCANVISRCTCSNKYLRNHYLRRLAKVCRYVLHNKDLPGNHLIYALKHDNRRDVFDFLSQELSDSILASFPIRGKESEYVITNVPRRAEAIQSDGYDHAAILAKKIAEIIGVRYQPLFVSLAKKSQKDTHGEQRRENAVFGLRNAELCSAAGKNLIIVDDVVTTGASLGACAKLAKSIGARRVFGAVLAIAFKDQAQ